VMMACVSAGIEGVGCCAQASPAQANDATRVLFQIDRTIDRVSLIAQLLPPFGNTPEG